MSYYNKKCSALQKGVIGYFHKNIPRLEYRVFKVVGLRLNAKGKNSILQTRTWEK